MQPTRRVLLTGAIAVASLAAVASVDPVRGALRYLRGKARGGYTVAERVEQFGPRVEKRLRPVFESAGVSYPPADLAFLAFKDSRTLQVYARDSGQRWRLVKAYPVLAASGQPGPKLRQGDRQVPEGVYRLESLNPNSRFHLSLRLDYPNELDRRMALADGRERLGGDIMIHGSSVSIGCLAMGDDAAEDLFVLSALAGRQRIKILISPTDFRVRTSVGSAKLPAWTRELYAMLRGELLEFHKGT